MRLPAIRVHHLVAAGLLAILAVASAAIRGPVRGAVVSPVPTTFSTEPGGLQGLFMVCEGVGIPAGRYTGRLADLDPETTPALAVVGEPEEAIPLADLEAWVQGGGCLLLATEDAALLGTFGLRRGTRPTEGPVRIADPAWEVPEGLPAPAALFEEFPGDATVLARGPGDRPWIVDLLHGAGRVVAVADRASFSNRALETPACAVLAVRLLEETAGGGRIEFCETIHGFGGAGDPVAAFFRILLGTPFGHAVLGAAASFLIFLLAGAKRFGRVRRDLEPPRRSEYEYLDALAGLLLSSGAWREAGRLVLLGVRRRVGRGGVPDRRTTVQALAGMLSWDRPAEAASLRAAAEALAAGREPRAMVEGLRVLDGALPPEHLHGDGAGPGTTAVERRRHATV